MEKRENAGYHHFLLFQQYFLKPSFPGSLKLKIVKSSVESLTSFSASMSRNCFIRISSGTTALCLAACTSASIAASLLLSIIFFSSSFLSSFNLNHNNTSVSSTNCNSESQISDAAHFYLEAQNIFITKIQ